MLKAIARRVLSPGMQRKLSQLLAGSSQLTIHYEPISTWPLVGSQSSWTAASVSARFKKGVETFDLKSARQSPEAAFQSPIVRDNVETLARAGLSEATLLDFGCGNGLYRLILAAFPATAQWGYVGADVDAELIEWCRMTYPGARFEVLEGATLPFRNGEFDVILASGVIQYIKDYVTILSELHRISKHYVLVSRLPLWEHSNSQIVVQHVRHKWGEEHHPMHVFRGDEMEALFEKLGFSILFHGYGTESYYVPGVSEPVVHNLYLLQKSTPIE